VVDEAGMVATRDLSALLDAVERAHGKLVLVGDHRQLPELEAGGAFRGLVQRGIAIELIDNLRQVHGWERTALDHLRDGRGDEASALYGAHGRIVIEPTADDVRARLVRDWSETRDPDGAVMIAHRRADVADLNERARERLRADGRLQGPEFRLPGGSFAVGDRVVVKRNDHARDVHNGDRGQIIAADAAGSLVVRFGEHCAVLARRFLMGATAEGEPTLLHGYAITGHVAQGLAVDRTFVLATEGMTQEWGYVAMSRGRDSNRLYVSARGDGLRAEFAPTDCQLEDPVARLAASLRTSSAQLLAIDSGRPAAQEVELDRLAAQRALARAERARAALEANPARWLPGVRGRLQRAQSREVDARGTLEEIDRAVAERRHGARRFITGDERTGFDARRPERVAEHRRDRGLARDR
jgi:hypothetical protein